MIRGFKIEEVFVMRATKKPRTVKAVVGVSFYILMLVLCQNAFGASTITGTVYDKQRNSLSEVDVELLNDYYQMITRTKTDGAGMYQFSGLKNGRYTIRVLPFRYDLNDQEMPVEINTQNIRGGEGSGYFTQDFYLSPKKGGLAETELGIVFAQDVPPEAKKLFDKSIEDLAKKRTKEGILGLNEAVKLFPDYYLALHRLGKELFIMKNYKDAYPFFLKAVDVNPKSATSFYYLGYSLHNLGKEYNKSAMTALNQAHALSPASNQVLFVLGKVERSAGNFDKSEKHLLQAKKLSRTGVPEIHKELAQLYADDLKKYNEAANELELYLKASRMSDAEEKQTKKVIESLRQKAKSQVGKN